MSALPKGTRKELMLARRAIKTAITHLGAARLGLAGDADADALEVIRELYRQRLEVGRLAVGQRKEARKSERKEAA